MYGIVKSLHDSSLLQYKHVYGGFIKFINKQSLRAKEAVIGPCSKLSPLKPNNLVRVRKTHKYMHVVCEACKQSHVYTEHTL